MVLLRVWHRDYGEIYSLWEELKEKLDKNELVEKNKRPVGNRQQVNQVCLSFMQY